MKAHTAYIALTENEKVNAYGIALKQIIESNESEEKKNTAFEMLNMIFKFN